MSSIPAEPSRPTASSVSLQLRAGLQSLKQAKLGGSYKHLLPAMLNLRGQPYVIDDFFPFEPLFRVDMPRQTVVISGRQVSKTTSMAAAGIIRSFQIPYLTSLFMTPLFEHIRRFSNNNVKPFIDESPFRHLFVGTRMNQEHSVLQRSFLNRSKMLFSFASRDLLRVRGVPSDVLGIDEIQSLDPSFLAIIRETLSASKWGVSLYTGTPLSLENLIEDLRLRSSMGEWCTRCEACTYWNVPSLEHDLVAMIGPDHPDIGPNRPGVICAKCQRPIDPRGGRWIHANPDRRYDIAGYHVPQIIMPMHYADRAKWKLLLGKQRGAGNTSEYMFYNEVCGVSYDVGSRLVTSTDLKRAGSLRPNTIANGTSNLGNYVQRILSVDWGGGGEDRTSFTSIAVMGMLPTGTIEVIYGFRSLTPHEHKAEAELVLDLLNKFQCSHLVHDYCGAGSLRETFIVQAGYPLARVIPIVYVGSIGQAVMAFKQPSEHQPRGYYQVNKSRSLLLTCEQIKSGGLRFFEYDYIDSDNRGLLHDFLALIEEKRDSLVGSDAYRITRNPRMTDDFAQAVNMGCCALYHIYGWPKVAETAGITIPPELKGVAYPAHEQDWEDRSF